MRLELENWIIQKNNDGKWEAYSKLPYMRSFNGFLTQEALYSTMLFYFSQMISVITEDIGELNRHMMSQYKDKKLDR